MLTSCILSALSFLAGQETFALAFTYNYILRISKNEKYNDDFFNSLFHIRS